MTSTIAVDTSVAIPLLINKHADHVAVSHWWDGRDLALCGHALVETYSVLTRLPGELQLLPGDAARLIAERFTSPLILSVETERRLPELLASVGIGGGRVYDALVALAAIEHDTELATKRWSGPRPLYGYRSPGDHCRREQLATGGPLVGRHRQRDEDDQDQRDPGQRVDDRVLQRPVVARRGAAAVTEEVAAGPGQRRHRVPVRDPLQPFGEVVGRHERVRDKGEREDHDERGIVRRPRRWARSSRPRP